MGPAAIELMRALDFAARKHSDQRRKGVSGEPYVNHVAEVAYLLAEATGGEDPALVIAGLLHDTVEDTDATREEIEQVFGTDVADLVAEVSDDKGLTQTERKRRQVASAPNKSARARMLKLADKTSNLRSLVTAPPASWDLQRKRDYLAWSEEVVAGCRGVNAQLEAWFDEAAEQARAALTSEAAD